MTAHYLLGTPAGLNWQNTAIKNHHGINTPIFSLRSEQSSGIGEYLDLIPLISWIKEIGFDVLQLLPINDTGLDTSPYNAISSKALHPIYISLKSLPNIHNYPELIGRFSEFQELNSLPRVDYISVLNKKESFLRYYFDNEFDTISKTATYKEFVEKNPWLQAYALFKYFKSHYKWKSWQDWPLDFSLDHDPKNLQFHYFVQYLCFMQMLEVKEFAKKNGVLLKGDIPILINPDSADVWYSPQLFDLSHSAGAPPDMYCEQGQNWGFPLYNYSELAKDHFKWWRERLHVATQLYDLYRLDHIVGFYRIWAINRGDLAINGKFLPSNEEEWIPLGENLLKILLESASTMLPIGEDLGVIPDAVRESMKRLGICGTKMMRWERKWKEDSSYINSKDYDPISMTTVSTHDSETLILWWQNCPQEAKEYAKYKGWEYNIPLSKEAHIAILKESHQSGSLFHINLLQEYTSIFPELSWENPEDERINIPGVVTSRNWTFRYKSDINAIIQHTGLKNIMRSFLS